MRRRRNLALRSFCLAAALLPLPAGAIDLTGSWRELKNSPCTQVNFDGTKNVVKDVTLSSLGITQNGTGLAVTYVDVPNTGLDGWVQADAKKDEGRGMLRGCAISYFVGYQVVSAKTFAANVKGISGKMVVNFIYAGPMTTSACRAVYERYDTTDPAGLGCP